MNTGELKRPYRQKPVYSRVADEIQQSINDGSLKPGDQLLPERELAEVMGVSRTSIRQALGLLEGQGIIEITPRDGAYVLRKSLERAVEPLTQAFYQQRNNVAHVFEVRQIIEVQAGRLAAVRHQAADVQRLRAINRQFDFDLSTGDLAFEANKQFHLALVETAKNPLLTETMCTLLKAMLEVYLSARHQSMNSILNRQKFVDEHEAIIEAVAQTKPDLVAALIARHVDEARQRIATILLADA